MALHHVVDLRMGGQFLVGAIGDVVALRPVGHRCQVDVDEDRNEIAPVAKGNGLLDVGKELQLVFKIFRREQVSIGQPADILGAVDDLQMAFLVEEAGIAGMNPAVRGLGAAGGFIVLVVADEDAGRTVQNLATVGDLDLDPRRRLADRIGADFAVRLGGDVDAGLGLSVELFQVEPERAVEAENLRSDRFACRIADTHLGKAHSVLQRPVDKEFAKPVLDAGPRTGTGLPFRIGSPVRRA